MLKYVLPVALLLLAFASGAIAQIAPVMNISFEQGFDADSASGPVTPKLSGKPELVGGKVGKGLKSGPDTGHLIYPAKLLNPSAGTVEMWVKPIDWDMNDNKFHVFFEANDGGGALYLYKYHEYGSILMLGAEDVNGPLFSSVYFADWKQGEWHHIAGTWSADGVTAYVDGKPAPDMPVKAKLPEIIGDSFTIGDLPWSIDRSSSSVIDEIRIYDRALSPAHIAAHYAGDYSFDVPLSDESAYIKYEIIRTRQEVNVDLFTGGADVDDSDITAKVALLPASLGADAVPDEGATEIKFIGGQAKTTLKIDLDKAAEYNLVALITQNSTGKKVRTSEHIIVPDIYIWRDNNLGKEDIVLPPWTPVEAEESMFVKVWDRFYDFNSQDIIRQITSGQVELLAGPVQISQMVDGEWQLLNASTGESKSVTPTRTVLQKKLSGAGVQMDLQTTIEYDGLAMFELSCADTQGIEALVLDIPLRNEIAMYRHRLGKEWNNSDVTGNLPAGSGVVDSIQFSPIYWLGNNDRGLFWMCECDEYWPNGENLGAIEVLREQDRTVLRLNLLVKGQKLPKKWKFAFGLQATPVKPLPEDWRTLRMEPAERSNIEIIWPTTGLDSLSYFGYPKARNADFFSQRVTRMQSENRLAVPYLCLSYISTASPEWLIFKDIWGMGPIDAQSADVAEYNAGFAMASPASETFADFIVWKTSQFIDEFDIDGLYHDNTQPYGSTNMDAGCGYVRNGKLRPTYPILKYRELYRRMYAVLKSKKPRSFSQAHMSGAVNIPVLAFEDSYLDGEYLRGVVKDSYLDVLNLDTFRAEYMGRQWGVVPYFLPEFSEEYADRIEPTRGMMALLMLHDVPVWPIWCNVDEVKRAQKALDDYNYHRAKFVAYFDSPAPATTDLQDVYVSAYKKSDTQALLIVGNLGRTDRTGEITLSDKLLDSPIKSARLWPANTPMQINESKLQVSVPGLGYVMIAVE